LSLEFAVAFFLAAVGLGVLLSISAVFFEELRLRHYPRWAELLKLTICGILEMPVAEVLNTLWRALAIVSFLRKNTDWGAQRLRHPREIIGAKPENESLPEGFGRPLS
jgi:hypothetical protein